MIFEDGKGTGSKARVDKNNRMHVQSVTETEGLHITEKGDAYNINTGTISFSAAGTLLYIKNNEDQDMVIDNIIIAMGAASTSDSPEITFVRNPTGGDLITDATAVSIDQNRNGGSNKTLTADKYAGKSGGTLTGGNDWLFIYQNEDGRAVIGIQLILPKGASIGIKLDPKLSSGSVKAYAAAVVWLKDNESKD